MFAILVHISVIKDTKNFSVGEVQVGLQDFCVCIEMFVAAAVHKYTFGYETYANGSMKVLMEQRAIYLAQQSYKRAKMYLDMGRDVEANVIAEVATGTVGGGGTGGFLNQSSSTPHNNRGSISPLK